MELKKLILKNFRSHKNLTLDFNAGVTGIVGGNGTGKSSIVEAIIFLLTGEGYGKTKADMLTVGQVSGHVIGHMLIDGKEAVLERHTDTAKVNLKYDDKVYKKSSEVNELWDSLFQIDKHLVQNVIVSNQGEIALLFNGDNSTKEKLFQKIFMVPNTTKLRDTVWNGYIKTAPPEYPVKNTDELKNDLQLVEQLILMTEEQLKVLDAPKLQIDYNRLTSRKTELEKVISDERVSSGLTSKLTNLLGELADISSQVVSIETKLSNIAYDEVLKIIAEMDVVESQVAQKTKLSFELASLAKPTSEVTKEELDLLSADITQKELILKGKRERVLELRQKLKGYEQKGLSAETTTCPTCGSELTDTAQLIEHIEAESNQIIYDGVELQKNVTNLKTEREGKQKEYQLVEDYQKARDTLNLKLDAFGELDYNPEDHGLYKKLAEKYKQDKSRVAALKITESQKQQDVNSVKLSIAAQRTYDGAHPRGAEAELEERIDELTAIENGIQAAKQLEIDLAVKKQELKTLLSDIKENQEYLEKNKKREEYTSTLDAIYDIFHPSKFPRALIQTYSSTVTEYMNEVLASFDFPYTAKVNDTFGIDIFNEEGLQLPAVSGGQQVMVGFSLRLALHNMFVGAFPFMIVDEGSYGLNAENSKKYFEIIRSLNKNSKFKQVIVIDHHPELSEYVDNTINL
jgi:energy-coupling factor transporter ATP-binding protein EcfA2